MKPALTLIILFSLLLGCPPGVVPPVQAQHQRLSLEQLPTDLAALLTGDGITAATAELGAATIADLLVAGPLYQTSGPLVLADPDTPELRFQWGPEAAAPVGVLQLPQATALEQGLVMGALAGLPLTLQTNGLDRLQLDGSTGRAEFHSFSDPGLTVTNTLGPAGLVLTGGFGRRAAVSFDDNALGTGSAGFRLGRDLVNNGSDSFGLEHLGRGSPHLWIDAAGRVGIQTDAPDADIHLLGSVHLEGPVEVGGSTPVEFRVNDTLVHTAAEGYTGLGVATPARRLHVSDCLRLEPVATPPASPALGDLYADTDGHLYFYNGSAWRQLDN